MSLGVTYMTGVPNTWCLKIKVKHNQEWRSSNSQHMLPAWMDNGGDEIHNCAMVAINVYIGRKH